MKQLVLAALLTMAVFAAGYGARVWTESNIPLAPPPGQIGSEFGRTPGREQPNTGGRGGQRPPDRAQLASMIAELKPQIASYQEAVAKIDKDFDDAYLALLTTDQRTQVMKQRADQQERQNQRQKDRESTAKAEAEKTLTDEEINQLREQPMFRLMNMFIVPIRLEMITRNTTPALDAAQTEKITALLRQRRDKYEELVDSVPPTSIMLSRLAQAATRLGVPAETKADSKPEAAAGDKSPKK